MKEGPPDILPGDTGLWRPHWWQGFLWGLAEGTFFFIIPDIILSWASLAGPRTGVKILGAIMAGSLLAGFLMYSWASLQPAQSRSAVESIPLVREEMFGAVSTDYRDHGVYGLLQGPGSGIPYKIYAVLAPPICSLPLFMLISIPARLERLVLSWLVSTALGWLFRNQIRRHRRLCLAVFSVFWMGVYAVYWSKL